MKIRGRTAVLVLLLAGALVLVSCAKKEREAPGGSGGTADADSTISYVSDEISFGAFFDPECTRRTIEVRGAKQVKLYIAVSFPETMEISAVEWRLVLPEGVTVESDKFYENRVALLGTFEHGISETFPCVAGPRIVLHEFLISVPSGIKNGDVSLMPSHQGKLIAVALCDDAHSIISASVYKAVINPED